MEREVWGRIKGLEQGEAREKVIVGLEKSLSEMQEGVGQSENFK